MHAAHCGVAGRWRDPACSPARSALGEHQRRSSKSDQSNQKESTHCANLSQHRKL
jgi:hypothetical protein